MRPFALCLCVLLFGNADAKEYNTGMVLMAPDAMLRAAPTEVVSVSHCETPISIEQLGPNPGLELQIYHTSLVFHLPTSNMNSSMEFTADNFGASIFLPKLSRSASNEPVIEWNSSAAVRPKQGIVDYTYWLRKKELGTISGDQYNALLQWIAAPETAKQFATYFLFQLQDEALAKNASDQTTLVPSVTCYDFVGAALMQLALEAALLEPWSGRDWTYR